MNPAPNLFLVGPMGAGKTTIGRRVAELLNLPFHDLDRVIEARSGADIPLIFELEGEVGFRRREGAALIELTALSGVVLATGGGTVLDAENRALLSSRGYIVYLEIGIEQQLARLERDRKRPLLTTSDRRGRLRTLATERNPLYREIADLTLAPTSENVVQIAHDLVTELEQHWRRGSTPYAA